MAMSVSATEQKPAATAPADNPQVGKTESKVGQREELTFRQEKVAAEMAELEQRMFRLAEALKELEPENSSRLMLGLKFAREELILQQMKETLALLEKLSLGDAVTEQKQLLAKLERLHELLLSSDLDSQLRLERLRQIREILRRLDGAIKEEEREKSQTDELAKKEQDQPDKEAAAKQQNPDAAKFAALRKDQEGNRKFTEAITQMVRQLGDTGANAIGEMIRAEGSMAGAEGHLGQQQAMPASGEQDRAVASLKYARQQLEDAAQQLLDELVAEVRKRVIEALTLMLERQVAVRQSTELLGPRVKQGSRQALTAVVGLAKSEQQIINLADEIVNLVEETEFGIALPAALRVVRDSMAQVKRSLGDGDASERVVAREREIEADLAALLEAVKQMPPSRPPNGPARRGNPSERERELNRLVAELKMIRVLQLRVNRDTVGVDGERPPDVEALSAEIRQRIEAIEARQENVRDVTERLSIERGDGIQ
jgi:hypothetical protein